MTTQRLRDDMLAIWRAGVAGVTPKHLIDESVSVDDELIWCGDFAYPLASIKKITVIGAGKASGKMASAIEGVLAKQIDAGIVDGWVNVPENCVEPLRVIRLHGARPASFNEPTEAGVFGTNQMLQLIEKGNEELAAQKIAIWQHLVICLLSGGGSALMPLPKKEVSLDQKLAVTKFLSAAGATIDEINTVRKQLSGVKGGMLKQFCRGTTLVSLILSDVLGDPLDVIASGPTVENRTTPTDAVAVLEKYRFSESEQFPNVGNVLISFLQQKNGDATTNATVTPGVTKKMQAVSMQNASAERVQNMIIGNNATAVDAAGIEAERLGYSFAMICATASENDAEPLGEHLLETARNMSLTCHSPKTQNGVSSEAPNCLISGGEPTVRLIAAKERGLGGRNQQLVLAAICKLFSDEQWLTEFRKNPHEACRFAFLSGGTDGEDGPTDAAGAFFDAEILQKTVQLGLDPDDYLRRNDAYHFFEQVGGLIKTGPTGTNVCDVRVIVIDQTCK